MKNMGVDCFLPVAQLHLAVFFVVVVVAVVAFPALNNRSFWSAQPFECWGGSESHNDAICHVYNYVWGGGWVGMGVWVEVAPQKKVMFHTQVMCTCSQCVFGMYGWRMVALCVPLLES